MQLLILGFALCEGKVLESKNLQKILRREIGIDGEVDTSFSNHNSTAIVTANATIGINSTKVDNATAKVDDARTTKVLNDATSLTSSKKSEDASKSEDALLEESDNGSDDDGSTEVDKCARAEQAEEVCAENHWIGGTFDECPKNLERQLIKVLMNYPVRLKHVGVVMLG